MWDKTPLQGACFLLWSCSSTSCKALPLHGAIIAWALLLTPGSQKNEDRRSPQLKALGGSWEAASVDLWRRGDLSSKGSGVN